MQASPGGRGLHTHTFFRIVSQAILLLCLHSMPALADDAPREFSRAGDEARYLALIEELRCVKCQNQNLKDSTAGIAADLRDEIYRMMEEGMDDAAIVRFLVDRYGDFVLYRPPLKSSTWLLWFGPFVLFAGAVIIVGYIARRRRASAPVLTEAEQGKLRELLNRRDGES
ncbi:MAG: cytochrome c-type biogenesis protein CcmH [Gammaproteobacteria bacterium]|nr:MAG: cytochrome c-type biogenesis protein CcmH [Gammaproteobacteria bacterium]